MHDVFSEFALLLVISAVAGALAVRLRQPVLIAYIAVGVIVGPAVFGLVSAHDQIDLLAFSAHKLYGPKGIGALFIRGGESRIEISPLLVGGGLRPLGAPPGPRTAK